MYSLRRSLLLLSLLMPCAAFSADAQWFDIPSQSLPQALKVFASQAKMQLLYEPDAVSAGHSNALLGRYDERAALENLLQGTGFEVVFTKANGATVRPALGEARTSARTGDSAESFAKVAGFTRLVRESNNTNAESSMEESNSDSSRGEPETRKVEEIVVTAQKRVERLQDVPVPVTVLSAAALTSSNQLKLQDYYNKVPGLGLALIGDGSAPAISIRGISTAGEANRTVGNVIDDVSFGSTVSPGVAPTAPDIDPGDLARIEVLRGPQGTLYGASSMGGLLKFVTLDPSTAALSGRVQAGIETVEDGDVGYTLRGAVNVPLSETFAVRASGFTTREPGYVDNPTTGVRDVNRRDGDGGRLSALWRPTEDFSLKLSALYQKSDRLGTADVNILLGGKLQQQAMRTTGIYKRKVQAYSATLTGKLGAADLTSATGYSIDNVDTMNDLSGIPLFTGVGAGSIPGFGAFPAYGVTGVKTPFFRTAKKFSQEIRAVVPIGARIHWLVGAFYTDEDVLADADYAAAEFTTGARVGSLLTFYQPSKFSEYAAFTNITFDVTERLDIQFGGRVSENRQSFSAIRTGSLARAFFGRDPSPIPEVSGKDNAFTYLVTPRFKISPDLMAYGRLASGYRPGGQNSSCGAVGVPCQYDADTTRNYEVGFKGSMLGGAVSVDASLFYIDWKDIQVPLSISNLAYNDNAGEAKSQGAELSVETRPMAGLTVSGWLAWNDAELTSGFPANSATSGVAGDRLPYNSRFSGNLSVNQEFPLANDTSVFVGGDVSYVDDRKGIFVPATAARETFPSYTQVDLHAGARYAAWTLNAFVNNLTDKRGILRAGRDSLSPNLTTYIQPRTMGLSLARNF